MQKDYTVIVELDELDEKFLSADCQDSAASAGTYSFMITYRFSEILRE